MDVRSTERLRVFLVNWFFTSLYGMTLGEYLRLLRKHRFAVAPAFWPRAAFMGGMGVVNTILRPYENRVYGREIATAQIKPPVFILGHWRSGTTRLHNLLATDTRFAYPNVYEVLNPHTFLSTERYSSLLFMSPKTRMMDNMDLGAGVPFEDEFATCGTLCSPFLTWVFPQSGDQYDKYLTFHDVPAGEVAEWASALVLFYKKLTWKYDRPLLLKSPPHTGRIKLLIDMFPHARFIHIHRNPYTVFQSTQRQCQVSLRTMGLQHLDRRLMDSRIITRYKIMYDAFFEECELIPADRFHELSFEELEKDPIGQIEMIYDHLKLPAFDAMQPSLRCYVDSTVNYRKNTYPELPPPLRGEIARVWWRSFERWGYAS